MHYQNIAIVGSTGTIGQAFLHYFQTHYPTSTIHAISRSPILKESKINTPSTIFHHVNFNDERSLINLAKDITQKGDLDLVILATGFLQNEQIKPEKSLNELSFDNMTQLYYANTIVPALLMKYLIPCLSRNTTSIFTALSARVGSIGDNRLGGWYSYRASKAALNMLIKSASIELKRTHPKAIMIGLHPGTVRSRLSEPYLKNQPPHKIFTPEQCVHQLMSVIHQLTQAHSGNCLSWDGSIIIP